MARKYGAKHVGYVFAGVVMLAYGVYKMMPVAVGGEVQFHVWSLYLYGREALIVGSVHLVLSLLFILMGVVGDAE